MLKHNLIKAVFVFFAMAFCAPASFSATYYIDYVRGADSNNGTATEAPWKRCPGMIGFAGNYSHSAGDVFVFKGGVTWPADVLKLTIGYSGSSGNSDVYMGGQRCGQKGSAACNDGVAWGSDYPLFDGGDAGRFQSGLILASRKNCITIDGIKIIRAGNHKNGSGQGILFGGGSDITIKNCWLQPNGINAFAYSIDSGTYTAIYFHDNIIKQAGRVHLRAGNARLTDVKFYNNTMYGGYDYNPVAFHSDGFMIGGTGLEDYAIQGLYIYNNKFTGSWARYATAQLYFNGLTYYCYDYTNGSHQPTVGQVLVGERSAVLGKVYNVTNAGGWTGAGTGTICVSSSKFINGEKLNEGKTYGGTFVGKVASAPTAAGRKSTKDTYIYNNLFVTEHNAGKTFSPGVIDISAGHENVKIYNNTIDARSNADMHPSHCIFLGAFAKNIDIKNNILAGCYNGITLGSATVDEVSIDYNLYYTMTGPQLIWDNRPGSVVRCNSLKACQALGYESHGLVGDPKFMTLPRDGVIGSGDWKLQPDSPAINVGANLSAFFTTDLIGNPRTGKWDIGAYERKK